MLRVLAGLGGSLEWLATKNARLLQLFPFFRVGRRALILFLLGAAIFFAPPPGEPFTDCAWCWPLHIQRIAHPAPVFSFSPVLQYSQHPHFPALLSESLDFHSPQRAKNYLDLHALTLHCNNRTAHRVPLLIERVPSNRQRKTSGEKHQKLKKQHYPLSPISSPESSWLAPRSKLLRSNSSSNSLLPFLSLLSTFSNTLSTRSPLPLFLSLRCPCPCLLLLEFLNLRLLCLNASLRQIAFCA